MAVNKVVFGGETVVDLTEDTVTAGSMLQGVTAHAKDGSQITGTIENKGSVQLVISDWENAPAVHSGYYNSVQAFVDDTTMDNLADYGGSIIKEGFEILGVTGTLKGGSPPNYIQRGQFTASSSGATYVDVTFDTAMDAVPTLIFFWEATTTYSATARTKGGFGMSERIAHYNTSGATTYYQRRWYGTTSNTIGAGSSSYPITSSYGSCIRNATASGFRAYCYSSTYKLYGTFNYIAVYAPA